MDIVSTLKQVALSLFVRRKKWIALTVAGALALFFELGFESLHVESHAFFVGNFLGEIEREAKRVV